MKRCLSILLAMIMVLMPATAALAVEGDASALNLVIGTTTAKAGDTVELTVEITNNPGIYYLGMYFDYDTEALTLQSVRNESDLTYVGGKQHIWYANGIDNSYGDGTLATLTFVVNEGAADGDYEIGILTDWAECYNADEDDVSITFGKGVIKVCSHASTTVSRVEPTCTASGEAITNCANCGKELSRETLAPLGHTEGEWIVDVEPACTTEGAKHQICAVCGATVNEDAIPAKGHGETVSVEVSHPTCTETGENYIVCFDCDELLEIEVVPALGHTEGEWVVEAAPTCTKEGLNVKRCTVCKDVVDSAAISVVPHNYNDGRVTAEPTCAKEGVLTYSCIDCGHSYTEPIAKVAHTYDALGICSVCGAESALYISATETKCAIDDIFTVELNLERNSGIFYLSLLIDYDTEALELVSVENSGLFNMTAGKLYVWTGTANNIEETGTLVTLTFAVKETAAAETTYPINVTVYECYDENEENVDAVAGNGSVYVFDYVYGDANGDGVVNGKDATRLMRYLASIDPVTGESSVVLGPTK